jgi:DNA-binding transcriptional MerR regulator
MSKSPDAFRTISEVAEWLGIQAHVLRFWESKFAQVKPVKRAGGRRYYRPADMLLIGGIKKLLHDEGMTIKGVQGILREHGVAHVSAMSQSLDETAFVSAPPAGTENDDVVVPFSGTPRPEQSQFDLGPGPDDASEEDHDLPTEVPSDILEGIVAAEETPDDADDEPEAAEAARESAPAEPEQADTADDITAAPEPAPAKPVITPVDVADPPAEDQITCAPGVLSGLAETTEIAPEQRDELEQLAAALGQLQAGLENLGSQ